jgi:hypothetical protein
VKRPDSRPRLSPPPGGDPLYQAFLTQLIAQHQPVRAKGRPNSGNDPAAFHRTFLAALQEAVAAVSARVRTCPHCGWLFLKHRKQLYCSPRCAQQASMKRFEANNPRYRRERAQAERKTH